MKNYLFGRLIVLLTVLCSLSASAHTFYEGITDISFNTQSGNIEIVHHFTTHDFEIMLSEQKQQKISADQKNYESLVQSYTHNHFSIKKNNQSLPLNWVGIEAGINETIIYQEIPNTASLNKLTVYNQMLTDFYPRQINRLNYTILKTRGTLIFTASQTIQTIIADDSSSRKDIP